MTKKTVLRWAVGLFGAAVNSAAIGGSTFIVDPNHFNPEQGGWGKLSALLAVAAVTGALLYLAKNPLPADE